MHRVGTEIPSNKYIQHLNTMKNSNNNPQTTIQTKAEKQVTEIAKVFGDQVKRGNSNNDITPYTDKDGNWAQTEFYVFTGMDGKFTRESF